MENLEIYEKLATVPEHAQKEIRGGRLKGMTDIKPMWRIERMTEVFGPCGVGWKTVIKNKEIIEGADGEKVAIVDIDLFVKIDGKWSDAIEGTGGSSFVAKENKGLYTSDECFKMAYTDAISVACKSLGLGASVYWGDSKYDVGKQDEVKITSKEQAESYVVTYGKYAGMQVGDIVASYPDYAFWLYKNGDETVKKCLKFMIPEN
jgi:hypothetical protein